MSLKKWQRIFVNRTLNMGDIKAIGFDVDNTLVQYRRENFEALAFRKTLEKLIAAGYPEDLLQLQFDPKSVIRGLLVDTERGNVLKVDGHKYVKIAFHGKHKLNREERHKIYNAETFKPSNLICIDTFFSLSEVQLFIEIVDYMDSNPGKINKSYKAVYKDLRHFIDLSHKDGSIKEHVVRNLDIFIKKDKYLPIALMRMIEGGKSLFLITNSDWSYTNIVMSYILNDMHKDYVNWKDYFEYIVVGAGKPGFFTGNSPFYEVITDDELIQKYGGSLLKVYGGPLKKGHIYHGGNASLFQNLTGYKGDEILYVGDHMYGDIINSKGLLNWRTMLIVGELDLELPILESLKDQYDAILKSMSEYENLDEEVQLLRTKIHAIEKHIQYATENHDNKKLQYLKLELDKFNPKLKDKEELLNKMFEDISIKIKNREQAIHPVWGETMKVALEKSRFAQQVEQWACLYTGCVSNLRFYSPFKKFVSMHDILPHDL